MNYIGIIPARYGSTRFPGKALVDINGKTMVQRVYEQALKTASLSKVVVATDDDRIFSHVQGFGGEVVMTSTEHQSGTDRCQEAMEILADEAREVDYVVNIQGDEPFILPQQINLLTSILDGSTELATLIKRINDEQTLFDPNSPKVVVSQFGDPVMREALYFSRQPIPYQRNHEPAQWLEHHVYYKHIGLYAYRKDVLAGITRLTPSSLERAEALEQLRWIENGYRIRIIETDLESHGIDTPMDLKRVVG
ncbi:3-deoxy-manno-octulosonate cytidylyltransferase [Arsenicibacter rosenii]|uniref:3-deoxy-manno-octulosonate cytidylyltransferase n=1 Tax=Arsenicibacter rosenii TaxID=1750698 RepID=A0A1S2VRE4_9BACT|nr:3-deoxy-manno-octulosonate cytidylyltransferase [Arsenicibacter rosenii]OIN60805.1 3-deoxy-manno-octulosonate cytidylyltransferase [Arsenicibacter rosenii]